MGGRKPVLGHPFIWTWVSLRRSRPVEGPKGFDVFPSLPEEDYVLALSPLVCILITISPTPTLKKQGEQRGKGSACGVRNSRNHLSAGRHAGEWVGCQLGPCREAFNAIAACGGSLGREPKPRKKARLLLGTSYCGLQKGHCGICMSSRRTPFDICIQYYNHVITVI